MVKILPSRARGVGSVPGWGTKISWPQNQNINQKQYSNKFNKDCKNGPHKKKVFKEKLKRIGSKRNRFCSVFDRIKYQ